MSWGRGHVPPMEERYERLTVLGRVENSRRNKAQYRVQCACGSPPFVVLGDSLRRRKTKSCGCRRDELTAERNRERADRRAA